MEFKPIAGVELTNFERLSLPPDKAKSGWIFDVPEIIGALDYLGIEDQVKIRFITAKRRRGTYHWQVKRGDILIHRIMLHQRLGMKEANGWLWHELCHAQQLVQYLPRYPTKLAAAKASDRDYKREGRTGYAYETNTYELAANVMQETLGKEWLLLKEG